MLHGASLKIQPTWVSETTTIDFQWDDDSLSKDAPIGKWWGDLAYLAGTGSNEGEWQWDSSTGELTLWVWVPGSHRRLVATLNQFTIPVTTGMTGEGHLAAGLVPTTQPPDFSWEAFAGDRLKSKQGTP